MPKFIIRQLQSNPDLADLELPITCLTTERQELEHKVLIRNSQLISGELVLEGDDMIDPNNGDNLGSASQMLSDAFADWGVTKVTEVRYAREGIYIMDEIWEFDSEDSALKYINKFKGNDWYNWYDVKAFLSQQQIYQTYLFINDQGKQAEVVV